MVKHLFQIYHKVVNELDKGGNLRTQFTIDVDKMRESEVPLMESLRCQLKISKIIDKEIKTTYITFDATDPNIKLALSDMYLVIEEFMLQEGINNRNVG
jgi:hypothetical protein